MAGIFFNRLSILYASNYIAWTTGASTKILGTHGTYVGQGCIVQSARVELLPSTRDGMTVRTPNALEHEKTEE